MKSVHLKIYMTNGIAKRFLLETAKKRPGFNLSFTDMKLEGPDSIYIFRGKDLIVPRFYLGYRFSTIEGHFMLDYKIRADLLERIF